MSEVIKVALVGTSCVGKSTLLDACKEGIGAQTVLVSEAAREYFAAHPTIQDRFAFAAQVEVQRLAFQKEKAAHHQALSLGKAAIICDRSVLDSPVYVSSQGDSAGALTLFEKARPWIPSYSRVYLLDPADVPFATDEVRDENEQTRQLFHETFLDFFAAHNIPYELLSGGVNERLGKVSEFINHDQR